MIEATENGEDISELLEFVPMCNCIDPNKVDDVLTPETRYQLTEEDNLYFQEKYGDVNQLSIYEMDCLLFELQEMGAITQSERLAAHPYYCADGTLGSTTQSHSSNFFGAGKTDDSIYEGDTLGYFKEQLEMLKKELFTMGLTWEEKETIKENAKLLTTVSSVLSGIFSKTTDSHEDTEFFIKENADKQFQEQWEQDEFARELLGQMDTDFTETVSRSALLNTQL